MFDTRTMQPRRSRGVGDSTGDSTGILSALGATRATLAQASASQQCAGQSRVTGTGTTDYACGFLRGWQRIFLRNGGTITIDPRSQGGSVVPVGAMPSDAEWRAFDQKAASLGVGGLTAQLRKNATPDQGLLSQVSRNLSSIGQGVASGRLDAATKGAFGLVGTASGQLDKLVPGAGGIIVNGVLDYLLPILPLLPGLVGELSAAAGTVPGVGEVISSLGRSAGTLAFGAPAPLEAVDQSQIAGSVLDTLTSSVARGAADLTPIRGTLISLEQTYQKTNGDLGAKLEAVGLDAFDELSFAVSLLAIVAPASLALTALQLMMTALRTAYTVGNALRAADALKKAADAANRQALAAEAALDARIAALEAEIERVRAQTLALQQGGATPIGTFPAGVAKAAGLVLLAWLASEVLS